MVVIILALTPYGYGCMVMGLVKAAVDYVC